MSTPTELRYSKDHEWVKVDGDKLVIGITDHAQNALGDIVFVELPEVDDEIEMNEPFGSVESTKAVSDLIAPVSGTIVEINEELFDNPNYVNESPYDQAWMLVVELSDESELEQLLTAEQYEELIAE